MDKVDIPEFLTNKNNHKKLPVNHNGVGNCCPNCYSKRLVDVNMVMATYQSDHNTGRPFIHENNKKRIYKISNQRMASEYCYIIHHGKKHAKQIYCEKCGWKSEVMYE